jgi:glycosyltransferase involved in cell wall biosynthesis
MPENEREGGARRIFHLLQFLRDDHWHVSFLARDATDTESYSRLLRQHGVRTYAGADTKWAGAEYVGDFESFAAGQHFDLAILAFWYIAEEYLPGLRRVSPNVRVIVDSIDLHFLRSARSAMQADGNGSYAPQLGAQYAIEMTRELNTYASADLVLTVSQKEADLINDFTNNPSLAYAVPLMEDLEPSSIPYERRQGILFLGNFRHPPNVEAVDYLFHEILPRVDHRILEQHPIYVVGNAMDSHVVSLAQGPGKVRLVGWVPSVVPYLHKSAVMVAPLLTGAGTKTKIVQALTVGTPTVTTSIGVEGLDIQPNDHILVADDPSAFAECLTRVLQDTVLWHRLSDCGRKRICRVHGREAVRERLDRAINDVLMRSPKTATFRTS